MGRAENLASIMVFHMESAISLMQMAVESGDLLAARAVVHAAKENSGSALERALWETYTDFMDPTLNPDPPDNVVILKQ